MFPSNTPKFACFIGRYVQYKYDIIKLITKSGTHNLYINKFKLCTNSFKNINNELLN